MNKSMLWLLLLPHSVWADASLPPVVVSGSLVPAPADEVPGAATVITRKEIERRPAATVADLLRSVPGVYLDSPGGRGAVQSLYLRGGDPNYTSVLIDGVRVNDPSNTRGGSFDFSTLNAAAIDRIEVIRGAASAVHGADALAGVVNIITRKGSQNAARSFSAGFGERGYYSTEAHAGGALGAHADYALTFGHEDNGRDVAFSSFETQHFNGKFSGLLANATEWQVFSRYADSRSARLPEDSGGHDFAVIRDVERRDSEEFSLGSEWRTPLADKLDLKIQLGTYWRDEDSASPGVAPGLRDPFGIPPNRFENEFARYQASAQFDYLVSDRLTASAGWESQYEDAQSDSVLDIGFPLAGEFDLDRETHSAFGELRISAGLGWQFSLGARFDAVENNSAEFSPRLALSKRLSGWNTLLKASYGEGFRPPSFFALGNPIVGNPALTPERSQSYELGLSQPLWSDLLVVDLNLFHTRYFDVVDLQESPELLLVNRSEVVARGGEAIIRWQILDSAGLDAQLSYVDTNIRGTSERLRNRPRWQGGVKLWWEPNAQWQLHTDWHSVGPAFDSSIPTGDERLESYDRLDLSAVWRPMRHWSFAGMIENLTNTSYQQALGFESPGLNFRLLARLSL